MLWLSSDSFCCCFITSDLCVALHHPNLWQDCMNDGHFRYNKFFMVINIFSNPPYSFPVYRYIEEHVQKTGVAIETQGFTFVTSGRKRESLTVSFFARTVVVSQFAANTPLRINHCIERSGICMVWEKNPNMGCVNQALCLHWVDTVVIISRWRGGELEENRRKYGSGNNSRDPGCWVLLLTWRPICTCTCTWDYLNLFASEAV